MALTLSCDSHVRQTANRWSFRGDPRVNNGIKKGYFPTVPDSCAMVRRAAPKFVPVQRSSKTVIHLLSLLCVDFLMRGRPQML